MSMIKKYRFVFAELQSKTSQVDVLVNNAGVGITGAVEELISMPKSHFDTNSLGL